MNTKSTFDICSIAKNSQFLVKNLVWNVRNKAFGIQQGYCELIASEKITTNLTWITKKELTILIIIILHIIMLSFILKCIFHKKKKIKCEIINNL